MDVALPQDAVEDRVEHYLDGFQSRHGLDEAEVQGNVVRLVVEPHILPAVLTTARESLKIMHLSLTTIVGEEPVIDSVTGIYPTANWHEREAYDMFGVAFKGHPDLRRVYMWQDHFDHHPLLKSFEISTKRTFEGLR